MDTQSTGSGGAASNSSDFVRKLYKMLEGRENEQIVRWSEEGDSFVVLENEKFTKSILPKHFKHSNFASFVRQLNKYDFHKVRHNNEESGQSPYGPGAWEFKHPDFKANNKDALDNIRRKAPVPRKPNQPSEDLIPTQQIDLVNTQLVATQQQLHQLQERYNELGMHHSMLLQEVIGLQKTVVNHEHVIQNVMNFLHSVDANQRRASRMFPSGTNPFSQGLDVTNSTQQEMQASDDDHPASPLQTASKLLNEINADTLLNSRTLEQMNEVSLRINGNVNTTPPPSDSYRAAARHTSGEPPQSASSTGSMRFADLDNIVYPVGQSNGIDPMYSEHIHNIPYPMPSKPAEPTDPRFQVSQNAPRKKANYDPGWIRQPQILLVEDDPTCRRIGGKFLYAFNCAVDSALDGLEAVNKLNTGSKYDLILMDIIMPNLDGVSACHLIRQVDSTPVIAMTSNIRSDDISMYFQHGMNDVLPKPFTKGGLLSMLEKHLGHLKKPIPGMESVVVPSGTYSSQHQSLKDEDSPGSSLSDEYMHAIRSQANHYNNQSQYGSAPHTPIVSGPGAGAHRRHISDISGGEDANNNVKRQQMFPHISQMHSQQR